VPVPGLGAMPIITSYKQLSQIVLSGIRIQQESLTSISKFRDIQDLEWDLSGLEKEDSAVSQFASQPGWQLELFPER
jgi:hypothetical protein